MDQNQEIVPDHLTVSRFNDLASRLLMKQVCDETNSGKSEVTVP